MACLLGVVLQSACSSPFPLPPPPFPHAIVWPPFPPTSCLVLRTSSRLPLSTTASFLAHSSISTSPSRGGSRSEAGDAPRVTAVLHIVTITVINGQMRGAKTELRPLPSGRLTVTTHLLFTALVTSPLAKRRPEREESVESLRSVPGVSSTSSVSPCCHCVGSERRRSLSCRHAGMSSSSLTVGG